ncbi:MAG TPA: heavy metal translocating P-type ATPase [Bryobacteraceae bacterium]|nr:heavy metal translocating P-type ATPase [Bryobacteraceae bacterium]
MDSGTACARYGRRAILKEEGLTISTSAEFRIHGMDCAEEVSLLRRELRDLPGILDLSFDVLHAKMTVAFEEAKLDAAVITAAVARAGLKAEPFRERREYRSFTERHGRAVLTAVSGLATVCGALFQATSFSDFAHSLLVHEHHGEAVPPLAIACYLIAMLCGMFYAAPKAWQSLRRLSPEMNALVAVSIFGAILLQEWVEGASLAFLFSLAASLESWSMSRARKAVSSLLEVAPAEATVVHAHGEHRVPVDQIKVGETVRSKPGERIACDGEILTGESHVDQALITGESIPVFKQSGSTVYAGTINGDGLLEIKVSRAPSDTLLARMLRMLEGAHHRRAPSEQFVERFSRVYTPAMFLLAILVTLFTPLLRGSDWGHAAYQGMVILLISCPCALVISTPVTVVAALASAARQGVLIKGGAYLEEAAKLRAFAFDKTGVLTQGRPEVQTFRTVDGLEHTEALRRLMTLEQRSEHPVGHAIVRYAAHRGVQPEAVSDFRAFRGRGAEAVVGEERFWAGSHRFLHEKGLEREGICSQVEALEAEGHTAFLCGTEREVWAVVALADPLRVEAAEAIAGLKRAGIENIVMLTGDNKPTATAVAAQLGIDDIRAELLPEEKATSVREMREEFIHVAMVGDGINDAQALASASVGIALGRRSTDVALETADVVLMNEDLRSLSFLLRHAKRASAVIRQNVIFAIGLKAVFLVLAFAGLATLWMAIAADMGATLLVTFNGLRLLRATR